jgi:hypothetical protein
MPSLILTSNILYLDIEDPTNIYSTNVGEFELSEHYNPKSSYHGEYTIIISKKVNTRDELGEITMEAYELATKINKLITYSIGRPLNQRLNDFYGSRRAIIPFDKVDGWKSNYNELQRTLTKLENPNQKFFIKISSENLLHWSTCKNPPLRELIEIINKYDKASLSIKNLIRFHTIALLHERDVKYLLLSKALEIVKELLPVPKNTSMSFVKLPEEIRVEFNKRSISWLYEMSNYRFETRHVVDKFSTEGFHVEMDENEYFDFMLLSDLLISYIIRTEFGLDPIVFKVK